jgi:uncharacterized protein (TIGR03435 family)
MKRREKNIDEILEHSLPSASKEQTEAACDRVFNRLQSNTGDQEAPVVNFVAVRGFRWTWAAALAGVAALLVIAISVGRSGQSRSPYAVFENDGGSRRIDAQEVVRTASAGGGVLTLADGSRVEMRSGSELVLEGVDDGVRIRLDRGSVIVNAAKQRNGHLYVQTKDVTVSVVGTVFLVNSEESGSRVAVIQGEVQVQQGSTSKKLLPGEQVASNPTMVSHPVKEEISWSRHAEEHLALLEKTVPPTPEPKRLEFEAASVKLEPVENGAIRPYAECKGVDGSVVGNRPPNPVPQGRCVVGRYNLLSLIGTAYGIEANPGLRIVGYPAWAADMINNGYRIEATAENPATATKDQLLQMMQSLLADRFKLKVSWETRDVDGYVLTAAKGGTRLQPASGDEPVTQTEKPIEGGRRRTIAGTGTLEAFAKALSFKPPFIARPVADRTGISGTFAFNLSFDFEPQPPGEGGPRGGGGGGSESLPAFSPLRAALQEQLGLRLDPGKVPDRFLIIEHVEKPSEN